MVHPSENLLAFLNVGPWEGVLIAVVALLLFGRRLPEVMRSLGRGVVEFKKGLRDAEDDLSRPPTTPPNQLPPNSDRATSDPR